MRQFVKILSFVLVSILGSVIIDHTIGRLFHIQDEGQSGLLFPSHYKAAYRTQEFRFEAAINSLGFRDHDFPIGKSPQFRILAIGDSFTYGWGVNVEDSWPKVLERNLHGGERPAEVANLGKPGAGPVDYADTAQKAVPLLRPDLVMVAVLQGDDLAQSMPISAQPQSGANATHSRRVSVGMGTLLQELLLEQLYPNSRILADTLTKKDHKIGEQELSREWRQAVEHLLAGFTEDERHRYDQIDNGIRDVFQRGELNPYIIGSAIKSPDYFLQSFDLEKLGVVFLVHEMAKQFGRIRHIAEEFHAQAVVVSVPFGIYVSRKQFDQRKAYGFLLTEDMLFSNSQDQAIELASREAGLPFHSVTSQFRDKKIADFFYQLDGHFNASGHHFYADQLTPIVRALISTGVEGKRPT